MGDWVDFKLIKQSVPIKDLLARYNVALRQVNEDTLRGQCPIQKQGGGQAFHVNVRKNVFHCFSCNAKGGVIELCAALEGVVIRDAALKLQNWFLLSKAAGQPTATDERVAEKKPESKEEVSNKPLSFQLKDVDPSHSYVGERGINKETAEYFGAGFFPGKGSMAGRVVIPIHSENGELLAYAGRAIDGAEPKYKLPAGFKKSLVLFNLHRALQGDRSRGVVVTEGFFDAIRIHDSGFPCVVALMGCSMSAEQERLLVENFDRVIVILDGDDAGIVAAGEIAAKLVRNVFVRVIEVPAGSQPDQLNPEQIRALLKT